MATLADIELTDETYIEVFKRSVQDEEDGALFKQCHYFTTNEMPSEKCKKAMKLDKPVALKEYEKTESDIFRVNGSEEIEVFVGTWSDAKVADDSFTYTKENEHWWTINSTNT